MKQAGGDSEDLGPWAARALVGARRIGWLKGLAEEELLALVCTGRVQLWHDQDMVTTPEENCQDCFLILEGGLWALARRADGSEFLISDFHQGETVGLVSLYRANTFPQAMRALGASLTLRLTRAQLEPVLLRHPQSSLMLLEIVTQRLAMSLQLLVLMATAPLRDQLHGRLEIWAVQQELRGTAEPHVLHGSQRELAAMMGVSRQSVNAALHELEADGVVKMSYGRIYLLKRLR
jgi:CRP-like cAMP-binding protein